MKTVTIGEWTIEGETDKAIVKQYILGTLKSMAGYDRVDLPAAFPRQILLLRLLTASTVVM